MRRLRSTASSSGSRIQFTRIGSRKEAGSSCGSTWLDGRASTDSDMRPHSFTAFGHPDHASTAMLPGDSSKCGLPLTIAGISP
jgi:hypothetical protein